jgi:isoleucyl-tRNA synthetase
MLLQDMAPVLSFTAEEAYQDLPDAIKEALPQSETVFALRFTPDQTNLDDTQRARWEKLALIRSEVNKAIEPKRKDGVIGKSLDAQVTLYATEDIRTLASTEDIDPREFFIISNLALDDADNAPADAFQGEEMVDLKVLVEAATGKKCERCWRISEDLGSDPAHPDACPRCTAVLKNLD